MLEYITCDYIYSHLSDITRMIGSNNKNLSANPTELWLIPATSPHLEHLVTHNQQSSNTLCRPPSRRKPSVCAAIPSATSDDAASGTAIGDVLRKCQGTSRMVRTHVCMYVDLQNRARKTSGVFFHLVPGRCTSCVSGRWLGVISEPKGEKGITASSNEYGHSLQQCHLIYLDTRQRSISNSPHLRHLFL